jgi:H+/Na+-translocating ferredoxin:NAD+ oxidoreductase subunit B
VSAPAADDVDALLPQTQCGKCGYAGCRPYAEAIAAGRAAINRCPPGGETTIHALSQLLEREYAPLDPGCGAETPRRIALIDESRCIGCTLCLQACPVDAIVGAAQRMHTVLAGLCSGCELCVAPCPVDCIAMAAPPPDDVWDRVRADAARARYEWRNARLARERREQAQRRSAAERRRAVVRAAVERARARKAAAPGRRAR